MTPFNQKTNKIMKKLFYSVFIIAAVTIVACGPSAEEKAAAEKKVQDSIAAAQAQQRIQDSIAQAEVAAKAAEEARLAAEKAKADSIAAAEVAASAKKSGAKKPAPKAANTGRTGATKEGADNGGKIDPTKPVGRTAATKVN